MLMSALRSDPQQVTLSYHKIPGREVGQIALNTE